MRIVGLKILVLSLSAAIAGTVVVLGIEKSRPAQDTPEATYKSFLLALSTHDEEALRALTIPADGFEWLLKGDLLPRERIGGSPAKRNKLVLKRLRPGEALKINGRQALVIRPEQVNERRVVLLAEGAMVPIDVQRVEGVWKIDPVPIIAGRIAADSTRRLSEETRKKAADPAKDLSRADVENQGPQRAGIRP